jgi:hypothetical protein
MRIHMKTLSIVLLVLIASVSFGQGLTNTGTRSAPDPAVWAKQTDLLHDASNQGEMPYVDGDTIRSRPFYSAPCWTLDSTVLSLYGTRFDRVWFRTSGDSLALDSLVVSMRGAGADTVSILIRWASVVGTYAAGDSLVVIKADSGTKKTVAAQTKVIPPSRFVCLTVTEKDGTPVQAFAVLHARRRW